MMNSNSRSLSVGLTDSVLKLIFLLSPNFFTFLINDPVQCCPEKAILIHLRLFGLGKGWISYCIKIGHKIKASIF